MHLIKPGLRHQDLEGIHLPSFRFSWKLKKLCRVDFLVFESWQTTENVMVLPCDFTAVCHDSKTKKSSGVLLYSMLACKQKQERDTLDEHRTFIRFFKHQSI
jgi:hypothetical protein